MTLEGSSPITTFVLNDNRGELVALSACIKRLGHNVVTAGNMAEAMSLLKVSPPQIVVVNEKAGVEGGWELTRELHKLPPESHVPVLVLTSRPLGESAVVPEEEVDDWLRRPFTPDELLLRLRVAERTVRRTTDLRTRFEALDSSLRWAQIAAAMATSVLDLGGRLDPRDADAGVDLATPAAWRLMDVEIARMLAVLLDTPFEAVGPPSPRMQYVMGSTITLTAPEQQTEFALLVTADGPSLKAVVTRMFGDDCLDELTARDAIGEVANQAVGVVKRVVTLAGLNTTVGLPQMHVPTQLSRWMPGLPTRRSVYCRAARTALTFSLAMRQRSVASVPATALREGMVLARDVTNEAGALLVPSGTRVTTVLASRLRTLGASRLVQVAEAVGF